MAAARSTLKGPRRLRVVSLACLLVALLGLPGSAVAAPSPIPTTLTISADPDPAFVGDTVTWTFTVTPIPDGGYVTLGGPGIPVDPATGIATRVEEITLPGSPRITAWYLGTENYLPSPIVEYQLVVNQHPVVATLDVPDVPVGRGDPFEVTVDLQDVPDGGRIVIQPMVEDGPGFPLVWADVAPTMPQTIIVPGLEPGDYQLQAFFEGTYAFMPATSPIVPIQVFDRVAAATLEISPSAPDWGEPTLATVTFDPVPDDGGAAKLLLDGGDAGWFDMDWEAGTGTVDVPWKLPGSYMLSVGYIPTAWPPRWVHSSTPIQLVVSETPIDQDPPVGSVTIAGGAETTMEGYVVVSMEAIDASPIHDVAMSCDGVTFVSGGTVFGDWGWGFGNETCDPNDGVKTIYVRWTDMYGNVGVASDSIILEANGPLGSVAIDEGADMTTTAAVQVSTEATDAGSGVQLVALSNDGVTWSTRTYAPIQAWTLTAPSGPKTVRVKWKDNAGHWSGVKTDTIVLDTTIPTVTAPRRGFLAGTALGSGAIQLRVPWSGADTGTGIDRYELAQQNDGGAWTTVATVAAPTATRSIPTEHTYRFRVRAFDKAGNSSGWAYGDTFRVSRFSEYNSRISYVGTWSTAKDARLWGGGAKWSAVAGSKASLTFTGRSIAWVAAMGPGRGIAEVYVNGSKVAAVDLAAGPAGYQRVAWVGSWTTAVSRKVTIKVLGTSGRPAVNLDALVTAD
jgi:hypothetical protein